MASPKSSLASFLLDNSGLHWKTVRRSVNYMKTVVKVASILSVLFGSNQPNLAGGQNSEQDRRGERRTDTTSTTFLL